VQTTNYEARLPPPLQKGRYLLLIERPELPPRGFSREVLEVVQPSSVAPSKAELSDPDRDVKAYEKLLAQRQKRTGVGLRALSMPDPRCY